MAQPTSTTTQRPGAVRGTHPGPDDVVTPAPWLLTGRGLVLLLASRSRRTGHGLAGRFSAVAFVDYESSDVGPYRELLHVPYVARLGDAIGPMVDHIWVTLHDSAVSGNANWGLSKTVAEIERVPQADGSDRWVASDGDGPLGTVAHRPFGPPIPVAKPRGLGRLVQARAGERFETPVGVRGIVRPTRVTEATFDPARVADLGASRILAAVSITHGTMTFGVPRVTPLPIAAGSRRQS